jgi:hypothetical protein
VVSADTTLSLTATAIDAAGRRGEPVGVSILVHPNPTPGAMLVSLARLGSGPVYEGSAVAVQAVVTPMSGVQEVRFSLDAEEQAVAASAPFEATLLMPLLTGARTVLVTAAAVDEAGNLSAPGALSLTVVDDLVAPAISLAVDPSGTLVSAGSLVHASAVARQRGPRRGELSADPGRDLIAWEAPSELRAVDAPWERSSSSRRRHRPSGHVGPRDHPDGRRCTSPTRHHAAGRPRWANAGSLGDKVVVGVPTGVAIATLTRRHAFALPAGFYDTARERLQCSAGDFALVAFGRTASTTDLTQPSQATDVATSPHLHPRCAAGGGLADGFERS